MPFIQLIAISFAITAWTNVLSHHVALLLSMLKHQVLHHSFTAATATMATVSMAMDRVPVVMYRAGVGVLAQSSEGYRETLQLLKLLFTWKPKYVSGWGTSIIGRDALLQ